jgi:PKD domain
MNRTRPALLAVLLTIALLGLAGSAAQAAPPTWIPGATISPASAPADQARVATNARGDSVAAWLSSEGSETVFRAALRPAGGQWGASEALTHSGLPGSISSVEVGIDDGGRAVAVWTDSQPTGVTVRSSTYSGGVWSASKALSPPNEEAAGPTLAVNANGDAVAAWHSKVGANYIVRAATRVAAGGWSSVHTISSAVSADAFVPRAAIDGHGDAVVVWQENGAGNRSIAAATRHAGAPWAAAKTLSSPVRDSTRPKVAVDAAGDATAIWDSSSGYGYGIICSAAGSAVSGDWNLPKDVGFAGQSSRPQIAMNLAGDAVVAWQRQNKKTYIETSVRNGPGGAWQAAQAVSDPTQEADDERVAIDDAGNVVAAWTQWSQLDHAAYASTRSIADGTWAPGHLLAAPQKYTSVDVGVDAGGDATAVYVDAKAVHTALVDATSPTLTGVQVPATGAVGQELTFAATSADLWSVVTTSWDFGDGTSASGSPAAHAYSAPGDYAVKVTALDAAGHSTAETHSVHVAGPEIPPTQDDKHGFAGVLIKGQTVVVHRRVGRVRASCPSGTSGACTGTLRLFAGSKVIGSGKFVISGGKSAWIRVKVARVVKTSRATARAHDGLGAVRTTSAKLKLRRK